MHASRLSAYALPRTITRQGAGVLLLAGCLLSLPGPAQSAPNVESAHAPAPEATAGTAPAAPRPVAVAVAGASGAAAGSTYQPKPSETLDQVIAHTLPNSPLRIELLRQAFIAQNPEAFVPGKVPKLRKGMALRVPDHAELLRTYLGPREPVADTQPAATRYSPSTSDERRRWVQFP